LDMRHNRRWFHATFGALRVNRRSVFATAFAIWAPLSVCWGGPHTARPMRAYSWDEASRHISGLLGNAAMKGATEGVVILRSDTGRVLFTLNPHTLLMPASNQKLLTSAAALAVLGPDFRFTTRVVASEAPDSDGVVHGAVYLKGGGDPLLNEEDLANLAAAVRSAGVRSITGDVVGDGTLFTDGPYGAGWAWDDFTYSYSPQVAGLNLDENVVMLECRPGSHVGDRIAVRVRPDVGLLHVMNLAVTSRVQTASHLRISRLLGQNVVRLEGNLPLEKATGPRVAVRVTVEDPPRYAAAVFARKLREVGVAVCGGARVGAAPIRGAEIAMHQSAPLRELLPRMNKPSDNLMAECLLRILGAVKAGEGSASGGAKVAMEWFQHQGMDPSGIVMADGSGLSRQTLVSPMNVAFLLRAMAGHPWGDIFRASLPIAGVDGTLRNRMKGTAAQGNCHAKTGTLSGVSSLSGYVTGEDGTPLAFAILMNHYTCPHSVAVQIQDGIVTTLAQVSSKPEPGAASDRVQDALAHRANVRNQLPAKPARWMGAVRDIRANRRPLHAAPGSRRSRCCEAGCPLLRQPARTSREGRSPVSALGSLHVTGG